jgi:hypothetical protein
MSMADDTAEAAAKAKQVAEQCRVVRLLCASVSEAHRGYAEILGVGCSAASLESIGRRSAHAMEALGELIKSMQADDEDDEWMLPVFAEARRLFPQAPKG